MSVEGISLESRVGGRSLVTAFDGGHLSSDGGLLLLKRTEETVGVIRRLSQAIRDRRERGKVRQGLETMLLQRVFGICLGYEDCNDFDTLRDDPLLKVATGRLPKTGPPLPSQPTLSRLENGVSRKDLVRMAKALLDAFVERHKGEKVTRIVLDFDGTDDPCHGQQEFEFFNGHYDAHCYLPLLAFATVETETGGPSRSSSQEQEIVAALLRPGNSAPGAGTVALLKRLVPRLKAAFPDVQIVFRADSGFASPEVYDHLEAQQVGFAVAMGKNSVLTAKADPWLSEARTEHGQTQEPARRFGSFPYRAQSWKRERTVVVKAEVLCDKENPRFVVTNLSLAPEDLYTFYTERGDVENRIKEMKDDLLSGRTSCHRFLANQFRLLLHACALVLLQSVRKALSGTPLASAQTGRIRTVLLKVAARVEQTTRRVVVHLPTSYPWQSLFRKLLLPSVVAQT